MTTQRPKRERLADALAAVASHNYSDARSAAASAVEEYERTGDAHVIEYMLGELSLTPAAAWELLATREVIPFAWLHDPWRRFQANLSDLPAGRYEMTETPAARANQGTTVVTRAVALLPHPATVADCVAIASDAPGVLAAEAIAREITQRDRLVWRVVPAAELEPKQVVTTLRGPVGFTTPLGQLSCPDIAALGYALLFVGDRESPTLLCPALEGP